MRTYTKKDLTVSNNMIYLTQDSHLYAAKIKSDESEKVQLDPTLANDNENRDDHIGNNELAKEKDTMQRDSVSMIKIDSLLISEVRLQQVSSNTFKYKGHIGKLHTFRDVMLLDSTNLYSDFNSFNKNRKGQKTVNIITGILSTPFFLLASFVLTDNSFDSAPAVANLFTVMGIATFGVGSIISEHTFGKEKNKYKKILLRKTNASKKAIGYLRLETTASGIGLVYRF